MNKIDKDKLKNVKGGLDFNPGGTITDPGIPADRECKQAFDNFSCSGCFFCTYSNNPTNTSLVTYTCNKGFYGTIVYDLSKGKIVE